MKKNKFICSVAYMNDNIIIPSMVYTYGPYKYNFIADIVVFIMGFYHNYFINKGELHILMGVYEIE